MDLAPAGQRWPRPGDVADLVAGGLRQRLRARNALGLVDALPLAGTVGLTAATVLATVWLILTEAFPFPGEFAAGAPMLGPFHTLGALAWIAWLLVLLAGSAGYGRWAVAVAITVTIGVAVAVAVVPAMELTSFHEPNLSVLAPQIALGMLALAVPRRHGYRDTAVITAFVIAAAAATVLVGSRYYVRYDVLLGAVMLLTLALIATGVVLTARRDRRALLNRQRRGRPARQRGSGGWAPTDADGSSGCPPRARRRPRRGHRHRHSPAQQVQPGHPQGGRSPPARTV